MGNYSELGKILIIVGSLLLVLGFLFIFGNKIPIFRYIGRLPGDFSIRREGFQFYFPLATSIIISVVISLIAWFFRRAR